MWIRSFNIEYFIGVDGISILMLFLSALGLPGLSGFISEVLVFMGSFQTYRVITMVAMSGVVLGAASWPL